MAAPYLITGFLTMRFTQTAGVALCFFGMLALSTVVDARDDLAQLSLKALMSVDVKVTSLNKREQSLSETPAAVYVIDQEMIQRSTARSLPELLRSVPGMSVAKFGALDYAISARGFNEYFTNKLLVMVDGRSVYNPINSGVYWDEMDMSLQRIERIEVIRGPGGAIWGANAVNGIINIITRKADADMGQGIYLNQSNKENRFGEFYANGRWQKADWRIDGRVTENADYADDEEALQFSGRIDWNLPDSEASLQYGITHTRNEDVNWVYKPSVNEESLIDAHKKVTDFYLQGEYTYARSPLQTQTVKAYWQHNQRDDFKLDIEYDILDVELRRNYVMSRQNLVYGVGARYYTDQLQNRFAEDLWVLGGYNSDDTDVTNATYNLFFSDEISFDWGSLNLGLKAEYTDYSGLEWLPSVRAAIPLPSDQFFWVALSRSVVQPSRSYLTIDYLSGYDFDDSDKESYIVKANPGFDTEKVTAFELGLKGKFQRLNLQYDLNAFYNRYDDHYGLEQLGNSFYGGFDSVEWQPQNRVTAFAYGLETSLRYQPDMHTNLGLSYSLVKIDEDLETGSTAIDTVLFDEGATSKHQLVLWADRQITNRLLLSAQLRKASALSDPYYGDLKLEPVLDLAARYQATPAVEFNLSITNLTDTNKEEIIFGLPQQRELWLGIGITF